MTLSYGSHAGGDQSPPTHLRTAPYEINASMSTSTCIHPTAVVDPGAEIGENVRIGPYCVIGAEVEIGEGTTLDSHVAVSGPAIIGRDNRFFPFCVIGADPQDLKFKGEHTLVIIGDRNVLREHVTLHRGTSAGGGLTRIGSDNLLMVAAHVAHDCIIGSSTVISNQVMLGGHVHVEDGAIIGGGAGIHHFATIGTLAFVGGLTRVKKDVPPFVRVDGDPAKVRDLNELALRRRNFSVDELQSLQRAFKRLYRENGLDNGRAVTMAQRIVELKSEFNSVPSVLRLCESLESSAAGVFGRSRERAREDAKYAPRVNGG